MKLLTTRFVDYLEEQGHHFFRQTLLLIFSKVLSGHFEKHKLGAI